MKRCRTTSPDQDEDLSGYSAAKEMIKFHTMVPRREECLIAFHSRLQSQAALFAFYCGDCRWSFKQRLIRDRLIMVLEDYLRVMVFRKFENPSVDDILAVYREEQDFQNHPGWSKIFPFLELVELEKFARIHPRFRKIVNSYLERGGKLVIGRRSYLEYADTPEIFSVYGQRTTALELANIEGYTLLPHFPKLAGLTLRQVRYDYDDENFPGSLKSLQIISGIEESPGEDQLKEYLEKSKDSLEHLSIVRHCFYNETKLPFTFTKLKTLTVCNELLETTIRDQPLSHVLEKLHLENHYNPHVNWASFQGLPIHSLTLDKWDNSLGQEQHEMVRSLTNLKHLRIISDTSAVHKDRILALNLESTDVYFLDEPEDKDLIVDMLDDDCIHLIMNLLDAADLAALYQVHSRFAKVADQRLLVSFVIGGDVLKRYPILGNRTFYSCLGRLVGDLTVCNCDEETFYRIIVHFDDLYRLMIAGTTFHDKRQFKKFPTELQSINLINVSFSDSIDKASVSDLFRKLNPTLKDLRLNYVKSKVLHESLVELTSIRYLYLLCNEVIPELVQFLAKNQDHMISLSFTLRGDVSELRRVVREMKGLESLEWNGDDWDLLLNGSCFPNLEELHLQDNYDQVTLRGLQVPKLKDFKFELFENFGEIIKNVMPNIESLEIIHSYEVEMCADSLVEEILHGATELKTLVLDDEFPITDRHVTTLVKGLRKLSIIRTGPAGTDWGVMYELRSYLKDHNRELQLNNVDLRSCAYHE